MKLYFCEFSCFCGDVVEESVVGCDTGSIPGIWMGGTAFKTLEMNYAVVQYHV
jgi:hypothetical protein